MGKWDKYIIRYEEHIKSLNKETFEQLNESLSEKKNRISKLEKDYATWFEFYLSHYAKGKCGWFHRKAAKLLIDYPIIFLLLPWFRGAAKSVHVCVGIPLYLMLVKKELKFMLLIGENEDKAKILLSDIQAELESNPRIISDYGKQYQAGSWAEGDFTTREGVRFMSLGVGQSPRGVREKTERPDYICFDDIDVKKRCNNPRLIKEAVDWLFEDLLGCFDTASPRKRFVGTNNIIHKNSIMANLVSAYQALIKKAKEAGDKPQHHILKVNLTDTAGNPEWKEYHTPKMCRDLINDRPYRSSQQEYFNNPIQDGTVFKADDIQYKKMLSLHEYDALVFYGDLSYKDTGDFKAMKLWGKKGRELHQIYCYCRQASKRNAAEWLYNLYTDKKLNKYNIRYLIEGLFAMDELVNEFDKIGDERGYYVPVVADKRSKDNKSDRIESICGYWERRNVFYNIDEKDNQDAIAAMDQLLAFEKGSGSPDDAPDADHGAISTLERMTRQTQNLQNVRLGRRQHKRDY